jgi:beta-carotene ketolase (CrtW type)
LSAEALPRLKARPVDSIIGASIAAVILSAWACCLVATLWLIPWGAEVSWWFAPLAIALQTFLYTGVFITAHDAMHGTVAPRWRVLNDVIGALCTRLYALFSFQALRREHRKHHRAPGTQEDPDFHDGARTHPVGWYLTFLRRYIRWPQIVGMAIIFNVFAHLLHIPEQRLLLFWVAPSLLSTVQLFYFGTYLPHRGEEHADHHHARSNELPPWLSLLTCYHFGYHWEHHEWPQVPWWRLPSWRHRAG